MRPLNYHEYKKDFDPNAHVWIFKITIKANGEIEDDKIMNMFNFTFKDIAFDWYWCSNYMNNYPSYRFVALSTCYQIMQNYESTLLCEEWISKLET